jgi:hypothetical protein
MIEPTVAGIPVPSTQMLTACQDSLEMSPLLTRSPVPKAPARRRKMVNFSSILVVELTGLSNAARFAEAASCMFRFKTGTR